jgi:hypothetical protein
VSQKAGGSDTRSGAAPTTAAKDGTNADAATRPVTARAKAGTAPADALSAALKGFVATLHKQAERNTDVIDVFTRALKDLNREMRDERMRREILERRLRQSEAQVEELTRVVAALARQGWVH